MQAERAMRKMSRYWLITRETETLLVFHDVQDLVIFLYDHQDNMERFRVLKNKDDYVVEVHLGHLKWPKFKEALENS